MGRWLCVHSRGWAAGSHEFLSLPLQPQGSPGPWPGFILSQILQLGLTIPTSRLCHIPYSKQRSLEPLVCSNNSTHSSREALGALEGGPPAGCSAHRAGLEGNLTPDPRSGRGAVLELARPQVAGGLPDCQPGCSRPNATAGGWRPASPPHELPAGAGAQGARRGAKPQPRNLAGAASPGSSPGQLGAGSLPHMRGLVVGAGLRVEAGATEGATQSPPEPPTPHWLGRGHPSESWGAGGWAPRAQEVFLVVLQEEGLVSPAGALTPDRPAYGLAYARP